MLEVLREEVERATHRRLVRGEVFEVREPHDRDGIGEALIQMPTARRRDCILTPHRAAVAGDPRGREEAIPLHPSQDRIEMVQPHREAGILEDAVDLVSVGGALLDGAEDLRGQITRGQLRPLPGHSNALHGDEACGLPRVLRGERIVRCPEIQLRRPGSSSYGESR